MRAGRLVHPVDIQAPPSWSVLASVRAAIEPKIDAGYDNPDSVKNDVPVQIRMRAHPGLSLYAGQRIVKGSQIWEIISIAETNQRGRELLINAREYTGESATYTPDGGAAVAITARIFSQVAYDGGEVETAERDTIIAALKSEFASTPGLDDTIAIRGVTYTIAGLADDGDNLVEYKFRVREP